MSSVHLYTVQCTVAYTGQALFIRLRKNTAMLNWSPCIYQIRGQDIKQRKNMEEKIQETGLKILREVYEKVKKKER